MNIGIQNARGDVIIILGGHSFVANDFISQNAAYLSKTGAACVGGPIHSIAQSFPGRMISLAMSSPFGVGNALFRYSQKEQYVDTVAFGAYRRQVFDEIGLFDEELVYNEDDEFNYRLRKHGGRIFLTPAIKSFYHTKTSLRQLWKQYYRYGFGKVKVIRKHPTAASIRHFVPFIFVSTLLVSGLLGTLNAIFLWLFLLVLVIYLVVSFLFSLRISARKGWKHLPVLPIAFACLHISYGLGSLAGLLKLVGDLPIDLLLKHVKIAQKLSPRIGFVSGNVETLPYASENFDLVLPYTVFTSILDGAMKKNVAREAFRVLKDGIVLWYDLWVSNPSNPDVRGVRPKRIRELFPGCYSRFRRLTLAPPVARLLAKRSWLVCYLLEKTPLMRTHYPVTIRKRKIGE
jgi:GT2 family glycosyltransferase